MQDKCMFGYKNNVRLHKIVKAYCGEWVLQNEIRTIKVRNFIRAVYEGRIEVITEDVTDHESRIMRMIMTVAWEVIE